MEAIFTSTPLNGAHNWSNFKELREFLVENEGIELQWRVNPVAKTSEKMRMYNFLFGPVMEYAVKGFTDAGESGIDKVEARYKIQAMFAKAERINKNKTSIYLLDFSKMNKERLHKFIQDAIFFIEEELGQRIPDSDRYKQTKLT